MFLIGSISGSSGSFNSTFTLPKGARYTYLNPSISGLSYQLGGAGGFSSPSGTLQTTPAQSVPLGAAGLSNAIRVPRVDGNLLVAIYNPIGGSVSVQVYGESNT